MKNDNTKTLPRHFVGIDWADREHEVCSIHHDGNVSRCTLPHDADAVEKWVCDEVRKAGGPIAVILEQGRGPLIHMLMFRDDVHLYPINPKQFVRYRESYSNAGAKSDLTDARLLAQMLSERIERLIEWRPDDDATRSLDELCRTRRKLVDIRTKTIQKLTALLKDCFPQALSLPGITAFSTLWVALMRRWPAWQAMKSADRRTIRSVCNENNFRNDAKQKALIDSVRSSTKACRDDAVIQAGTIMIKMLVEELRVLQKAIAEAAAAIEEVMDQHEDADLFRNLPGAGEVLAPRLQAAFGSQRDRFKSADDLASWCGIAPVTKQSGTSKVVTMRYACSKYLKQTFHEFANSARKWCPWSKAYYDMQRASGMKHNAAVRKLAHRWIRILFVVWKTQTPYNAARYLANIQKKNPAIIPFLNS